MLKKLEVLEDKYKELTEKISDPEIINDQKTWQKYMKEHADLEPIVMKYREYTNVLQSIADSKEILQEESDEELRELAKMELSEMEDMVEPLESELKILLLPKDPNDDKNVIVEIRGGAGGDEAALFAGKGAYSRLKYESGVHRVQRIPSTESGGRIHTSTATVAVLPEVETVEVNINPNDLRIDVFRSSGNGGQSVNTTDSAVRITHIPTGEVVSCQDGKSQLKNKEQALKILVARLNDKAIAEQNKDIAAERKSQVGTGDRSERIRTYNFPQGRVSDHRINLTLYKLDSFLDGDIDEMIDALITVDQTEKMASI